MSFSYFPLRAISFLGICFDMVALIVMLDVFVEKFTHGTPVAGWSSLMCVVLLSSGMIMLMLGILGEYIWRTLDAARTRPPFIIDEVKNGKEDAAHAGER